MFEVDLQMWKIERVYTHRESDRTVHHIEATDEIEVEHRLERLERQGETDDIGDEIESQPGDPLHVHVHESWEHEVES